MDHSLRSVVPDTRPPLRLNPSKPYHLAFGRGGTWHGYDTVVVQPDGTTRLHRQRPDEISWETVELKLDRDARDEIADAMVRLQLMSMAKTYEAGVFDGTQWIFWLEQGGRSKRIFCDNHAPASMKQFAIILDDVLARSGLAKKSWSLVPKAQARKHEKILWAGYEE